MPARPHRKLFLPFAADPAAPLTFDGLLANPLVPGVSVIAVGPAKGHSYYDDTNEQMVPVWIDALSLSTVVTACQVYANGVRVNNDHGTGISEAAGRLTAFAVAGDKVRAALSLFREYTGFRHLCEVIATIPDTIGLSIDFDGTAEVLDGKAYPRITEIYSCDLVPTPAANEGGLFNAERRPQALAYLRRLFDSSATSTSPLATLKKSLMRTIRIKLADGTEADATVLADSAPPATPPTAAPDTAALTAAVETALTPLKTEVGALTQSVSGLTQRVATVEAAITADAAADATELPADAPIAAKAMRALRAEIGVIKSQVGDTGTKLARRLGLEFAARAGTAPLEHASGAGDPKPHVYDQYTMAEGGEKTRLFRAHRSEIMAEGRRRNAA